MENEIVEKPDYVEELVNLIRSGEPDEGISEKIDNYHDNDIASALDELNEKSVRSSIRYWAWRECPRYLPM